MGRGTRGYRRVKGKLKEVVPVKDQQRNDVQLENQQEDKGAPCSREFEPKWYMEDDLSVGGRLKKVCDVVRTRSVDHKKKKLNLNCRVETVGRVIHQFCEKKKQWVSEIGFSSLCHLYDKGLPRILCYWLATRVDVANRCLRSPDGNVFPLTKVQVHWVLGIPIGPKVVPRESNTRSIQTEVSTMWDMYRTSSPSGTAGIKRDTILTLVERPADDELEFKRAFLMMVLGDFLCPTTCHRLSVSLLPAVSVALDAAQYDWCAFVIEHLFDAIGNFALRFYNDGYAAGCGGCTYFLAIVYLDRLRRPPVQWGVLPRYQVWTWKEINKAEAEDQLEGLDFGKIGCYDVAYGENHPLEGRDSLPTNLLSNVIVDRVISVIRSMDEGNGQICQQPQEPRGRKRRGATTSYIPYDYMQRKRNECTESVEHQPSIELPSLSSAQPLPLLSVQPPDVSNQVSPLTSAQPSAPPSDQFSKQHSI